MATNDLNQRSASAKGGAEITSANRPTMGTSALTVDGPRNSDFRAGFLEAKPGGVGDPVLGTKGNRTPMMAEALGARYAIAVNQVGGTPAPETQRNTRLVPPVMGDRDSFWAQ